MPVILRRSVCYDSGLSYGQCGSVSSCLDVYLLPTGVLITYLEPL